MNKIVKRAFNSNMIKIYKCFSVGFTAGVGDDGKSTRSAEQPKPFQLKRTSGFVRCNKQWKVHNSNKWCIFCISIDNKFDRQGILFNK